MPPRPKGLRKPAARPKQDAARAMGLRKPREPTPTRHCTPGNPARSCFCITAPGYGVELLQALADRFPWRLEAYDDGKLLASRPALNATA